MKVIEVAIGKQGISAKTGKKWLNYKITLEDGRKAGGFDPVRVGDEVTVIQNGEYLNYKVVEPGQSYPEEVEQTAHNGPGNAVKGAASPPNGVLDSRQRAIIRQHSQSMSLEVLKLKLGLAQLSIEDLTPAKLRQLADYFDKDVLDAAEGKTRGEEPVPQPDEEMPY